MRHAECADSLTPFIDGELTPDEMREVEEHLRTCADCRREVARMRALDSLMTPTPDPGEQYWQGLTETIMDRVRDEDDETGNGFASRVFTFMKSPLMQYATVAAVAAMVLVAIFTDATNDATPTVADRGIRATRVVKKPGTVSRGEMIADLTALATRFDYHLGEGVPMRFADTRLEMGEAATRTTK
jgi:anti-sigma factor RsiW